jgi:alpha-mannosidase
VHDDRKLVEDRLERVLKERIWPAVYTSCIPLEVARWDVPGEPVSPTEALAARYAPAAVGEAWGPPWGTTWFRLTGRIPPQWRAESVQAVVDLGFDDRMPGFQCEGLVYRPEGTVIKGLNPRNAWVPVADSADGGESVELYVEAAANPVILGDPPFQPTPLGDTSTSGDSPLYELRRAELAVFTRPVWELAMDLDVVAGLMRSLHLEDARRWDLLRHTERALDLLDLHDVAAGASEAHKALAPALRNPANASAHQVSAVGHAHIDSAWLWPLRETVRKVARTCANVTALMDDHPELVFAMSQAQQWAWLKEHQPDVYARVREHLEAGRFLPVGGMWVESDTNMPGSEAMARQFVHGKRFFREELGVDTQEVWLPDSFGYSAALPQLVRLSGSQWFLTQKISWSQTNRFPHHTFWWEGIDGTRVFTHFPPVDTYNSELTGEELAHAARNFREKGGASRSLVPFGHGDGGGGPTREMLARAGRSADLEGSPRVTVEAPAAFFAKAQAEYPDAPVWLGELYLEFHRGTYTSQARTKQGNRRSEHLLREAELWAATAAVRVGHTYPYDRLERVWRTVLLNQFHDILPGSSIAWVHREAAESYAEVAGVLTSIIEEAQSALVGTTRPEGGGEVVFNAAPHERDGVPALGAVLAAEGQEQAGEAASVYPTVEGHRLDNGLLQVTVDRRGLVTSLRDLVEQREVLAPGQAGNLLQLHPDLPNRWDAWDVDSFYRNTVVDLSDVDEVTVVQDAGSRAAVRVRRSFGASTVTQTLSLRSGARRLDIDTTVDWHEREKFLKAAFPLDVRADEAAAETQFGHLRRPTHVNTSWEAAKFEVCAHRWIHVAEPGYGIAVLNDSTYGHDVTRDVRSDAATTTTVRLSLLRAPRFPDPETDQGEHRFRYALAPGATVPDAVREGYRINLPLRRLPGDAPVAPLVRVDHPSVVVESVKLAEDRSGDVVVRMYEARGGRARAQVTAEFANGGVRVVNLLEEDYAEAPEVAVRAASGAATVVETTLRPFQILTLRFGR